MSKSDNKLGEPKTEEGLPQSFLIDNPATWNVKLNAVVESVLKNCLKQNLMSDFIKSQHIYNGSKQTLSINIFKNTLQNKYMVLTDLLLYLKTTGKVFGITCCLFQSNTSKTNCPFVKTNYWKRK